MLFTNLSVNQEYLLKVQALTASLYQENLIYPGTVSEVEHVVQQEIEKSNNICIPRNENNFHTISISVVNVKAYSNIHFNHLIHLTL